MRDPCILLMSGGCLVGQNVYACLVPHRDSLRLVASNSEAREPTLFDFDAVYLTPQTGDSNDAFLRRFEEILGLEDPRLIIPCRDEDVLALAQICERSPSSERGRFLCGNVDTAGAILDKMHSARFCTEHGLPFAATIAMDSPLDQLEAFAERHGYPLLAKPREGFASRGVFLILDHEQLVKSTIYRSHLLQEYLGDPAAVFEYASSIAKGVPLFHSLERLKHSIQLLISPDGAVSEALVTGNKMVFGKSERVTLEDAPDIRALGLRCGRAFAAAGWRGPLNIQCETTPDGRIVIYEFNGRFTGATAARHLLGHDEVGAALRSFAGLTVESPRPPDGATEVIRLPNGRLKDPQRFAQLEQAGFWGTEPR